MSENLGPPYAVVRASQTLGFRTPEDVAWHRLSHFLGDDCAPGVAPVDQLFGYFRGQGKACPCGQPLPALEPCTFVFASAKVQEYALGQCRRCRTIFWEEE